MKAGIIGFGVGEQHIKGYEKSGVEVVAICDFNEEKISEAKKKYPKCKIYLNSKDLVSNNEIDIVSIASYDQDHYKQIINCITSKKHVFCEKPICTSEEELFSIREELKKYPELKLSTNTILRKSERFNDLYSLIKNGEIGEIFNIEGDYNYGKIKKITEGWRSQVKNYSIILGGGIHLIDLFIWLTNSRVDQVFAFGNKFCTNGTNFKYPDFISSILSFKNGLIGKINANFGCVYPHFHKLTVYGTKGTFENNLENSILIKSRDINAKFMKIESKYPGLEKGDLIPGFVNSIKNKSQEDIKIDDIFHVMSTCFAIENSIKSGKTEKVKL